MLRVRVVLMALVAAFAFSAVASASALAAVPADLTVNRVEPTVGEGKLNGKQVGSSELIVAKGGTAGPEIACNKGTIGKGSTIKAASDAVTSTVVITFSECKVTNAEQEAKCKVEAIKAEAKGNALTMEGANGKVSFTVFAIIVINNVTGKTCPFKTSGDEVKGTQECTLPGATTEAAKHNLKCVPTGSKLTCGGKTCAFNAEFEFELTSFTGISAPFEFSFVAS